MFSRDLTIAKYDADLFAAMEQEAQRQEEHIELIASENYTSPAVMEAQGSVLTNKYAEGYPGKRYYGGCEHVDVAERLAIERLKVLFDCDWANVQPHAGAQANAAVFLALANPGDTVMGMNLAQGGHLTHGNPSNFSGRHYKIVPYGLDPLTGLIDYDEMERIAEEVRPKLLITGGSEGIGRAMAREMSAYMRQLNPQLAAALIDRVAVGRLEVSLRSVMVALQSLQGTYSTIGPNVVITASLISSIPTVLLFVALRKYFMAGLQLGSK